MGSADSGKVRSRTVRPGIVHSVFHLAGPAVVNLLSVDLTAPGIAIDTFRPESLTRTTEQALLAGRQRGEVVAAVNADFFSFQTHWPVGNQVASGVPVHGRTVRRSHLTIYRNGGVGLDAAPFDGVALVGPAAFPISAMNSTLGPEAALFNVYSGRRTWSDSATTTVLLRIPDAGWTVGDTMITIVEPGRPAAGSRIPEGFALLVMPSGQTTTTAGDTVKLVLRYGSHPGLISAVVGGAGRILLNGSPAPDSLHEAEGLQRRFITDRHPRTFVAIDRDTTRLYLVTVDGRQTSSIGMNFEEMSRFLLSIGATEAINLDGGGSTTMVVEGRIVNSPSDRTGERAVANIILILWNP